MTAVVTVAMTKAAVGPGSLTGTVAGRRVQGPVGAQNVLTRTHTAELPLLYTCVGGGGDVLCQANPHATTDFPSTGSVAHGNPMTQWTDGG